MCCAMNWASSDPDGGGSSLSNLERTVPLSRQAMAAHKGPPLPPGLVMSIVSHPSLPFRSMQARTVNPLPPEADTGGFGSLHEPDVRLASRTMHAPPTQKGPQMTSSDFRHKDRPLPGRALPSGGTGVKEPDSLRLIPEPVSLAYGDGEALLPLRGRIGCADEVDRDLGDLLSHALAEEIESAAGLSWDRARGGHWPSCITLDLNPELGDQEYRLTIEDSPTVHVTGGDGEGLRYGVQTLRQIIRQCGRVLPVLDIEDRPAYRMRVYSLDVTRGRVPTMEWLKHWADILAFYKFNQLQLYIEHSFAFDGMSESWRGKSPLRPQDIMDFDAYCARLGIELVPSISTFGHHYTNLRTRGLRDLGEFPEDADRPYSFIERQEHHTLNVTHPKAFEFSTGLIDSYADLFRSDKFNIGADETFDLGKGRSRDLAGQRGVADMYADYLIRLCDHVRERGGRPMYWGDIAVSMPEVLERLPEDGILLNWLYDPKVGEEKVRLVAETGARQVVCAAVQAWNSLIPNIDGAWRNISRLSAFGMKYHAVGAMVTDWGDYGHINDPRMSMPGLAYASQCFWNMDGADKERVDRALSLLAYENRDGAVMEALTGASHCISFGWDDMVRYMELDDGRGGLNADVTEFLTQINPYIWDRGLPHGLAEARRVYLATMADRLGDVPENEEGLFEAEKAMGRAAARGGGRAGRSLQAQMVALEGQCIFNRIGWILAGRAGIVQRAPTRAQSWAEAERLETWFETYRNVWRSVSRESELRRISSLIWKFADMLREDARG